MMRLKGFTLTELLVTLSVFSLAMIAVLGLFSLGARLTRVSGIMDQGLMQARLFQKKLQSAVRESVQAETLSDGGILFRLPGERTVSIGNTGQGYAVRETPSGSERLYRFPADTRTELRLMGVGGRRALHFSADARDISVDRYFLLNFTRESGHAR